jgi:3'(2'), 5'-bisphosphate nucleotidase
MMRDSVSGAGAGVIHRSRSTCQGEKGRTRLKRHSNITSAGEAGLLDELTTIVSQAAAAVLAARAGGLDPRTKPDHSPVTAADEGSEAVIVEGVARLLPGIAIVAEEAVGRAPPRHLGDSFVLVDPLDGTRELLAGRDEFTVNVALVRDGLPRVGIVCAPALGLIWRTAAAGGAERLRLPAGAPAGAAACARIQPRPLPPDGIVAAVSRSHLDNQTRAFLARMPKVMRRQMGSAVKFCQVAEGTADLYPRLGPTHEWDVGAGHAVLAAAGGTVTAPDGGPLSYGRIAEGFLIPAFLAWGDPSAAARLVG